METSLNIIPALLSDKETARFLGLHVSTIWAKAKSGELPAPIRLGGRTLWRRDEIMAAIEAASAARDAA